VSRTCFEALFSSVALIARWLCGYSTPPDLQLAVDGVAGRAAAYGFPGKACDGNDVLGVWEAMREALARARAGTGPTLLECRTYRWHGHSEHDKAM
jgi:pyruvate dehydrogenase E1 component alpha subunit